MPQHLTPFDPEPLLALVRQADRLESLPRTGYLVSRIPLPENVAAHSYGVTLVAMLLADAVAARIEADGEPGVDPPNIERVLRMALLHDVQEALTTDIPSPVKRALGPDIFEAAELRAAQSLLSGFGDRYLAVWQEYEAVLGLEARIVRAADRIQMFVKVLQYENAGLGDTRRFWRHEASFDDFGISEARVILDRLAVHHAAGDWPAEDTD